MFLLIFVFTVHLDLLLYSLFIYCCIHCSSIIVFTVHLLLYSLFIYCCIHCSPIVVVTVYLLLYSPIALLTVYLLLHIIPDQKWSYQYMYRRWSRQERPPETRHWIRMSWRRRQPGKIKPQGTVLNRLVFLEHLSIIEKYQTVFQVLQCYCLILFLHCVCSGHVVCIDSRFFDSC